MTPDGHFVSSIWVGLTSTTAHARRHLGFTKYSSSAEPARLELTRISRSGRRSRTLRVRSSSRNDSLTYDSYNLMDLHT